MKTFLAVFLAALSLSACENTKNSNGGNEVKYDINKLEGTWKLEYILSPKNSFEELYPASKPFIKFEVAGKKMSGTTSCNSFSGSLVTKDSTIDFSGPIAMTEMYCPDSPNGETVFTETLTLVTSYKIEDSTLFLMSGDTMTMRFVKQDL